MCLCVKSAPKVGRRIDFDNEADKRLGTSKRWVPCRVSGGGWKQPFIPGRHSFFLPFFFEATVAGYRGKVDGN